jgi:hypothetical protein
MLAPNGLIAHLVAHIVVYLVAHFIAPHCVSLSYQQTASDRGKI